MTDLTRLAPAERHRVIAGAFSDRVRGTRDWDAPAPVDGWTARDVVGHLTTWLPGFLAGGSDVHLSTGPDLANDPVGAWQAHADGVQAVLDDPGNADRTFTDPHTGSMPLPQAIDRFYTVDIFMHTWDLARATGQDDALDPTLCAELLSGMEAIEDVIRRSGQYGERVAIPDDADPQTRLLGFIGRDPLWGPHPGAAPRP